MRNLVTILVVVILGGCGGVEEAPPAADEAQISEQAQALCAPPISPPRCGPRNCVAMCVTCFYDLCRRSGGSCTDCRAEMEQCKRDCNERECPPSDPFCDFR